MTIDVRLAELLASRICHDLASPIGTLAAMEGQTSPAAAAIVAETTRELTLRVRLCALAFGQGDPSSWPEIAELLRGAPSAHRVRFELPDGAAELPSGAARLAAAMALLGAEALPRGGVVGVSEISGGGLAVLPQGRDAAWPAPLLAILRGEPLESAFAEGSRRVLSPWVATLAAGEGLDLQLAPSAAAAEAAPLLVAAPGARRG